MSASASVTSFAPGRRLSVWVFYPPFAKNKLRGGTGVSLPGVSTYSTNPAISLSSDPDTRVRSRSRERARPSFRRDMSDPLIAARAAARLPDVSVRTAKTRIEQKTLDWWNAPRDIGASGSARYLGRWHDRTIAEEMCLHQS